LQVQQHRTDLGTLAAALDDGDQIAEDVGPAELASPVGQQAAPTAVTGAVVDHVIAALRWRPVPRPFPLRVFSKPGRSLKGTSKNSTAAAFASF